MGERIMFTSENTQGYSDDQLTELNREWTALVEAEPSLREHSPEWKHRRERLLRDYDQRHPID